MGGYLLLFAAGLIAGVLNVIAGGGSFLTLPILMFLGLPPGVANGTNRVGILLQNVGAVWSFEKHGVLDWRYLFLAAVPATLDSVRWMGTMRRFSNQSLMYAFGAPITARVRVLPSPLELGSQERSDVGLIQASNVGPLI